jgi:hypothetical protein
MKLYRQFAHRADVTSVLNSFLDEPNVVESIMVALKVYEWELDAKWGKLFILRRPVTDDVGYPAPKEVGLAWSALARLALDDRPVD